VQSGVAYSVAFEVSHGPAKITFPIALSLFSGSFFGLLLCSGVAGHGIPKYSADLSQHLSWSLDRHMSLDICSSRLFHT